MNNKVLYIFIVVGLSVIFFLFGWYLHQPITGEDVDEYEKYVASLDTVCPFVGTAMTGECLDREIDKQKQLYDSLSKELLTTAETISEKQKAKNESVPLEISGILSELPEYNKIRDTYIGQLCGIRNILITGTAIVEESKKCFMYYNSKDIQMLESIGTSVLKMLHPL